MKNIYSKLAALAAFSFLSAATPAEDWPQWRGSHRDDISKETGLLKDWPEGGPKRVWIYEKGGNGYSGPAVAQGKLFTMGARDGSEALLALNADTGAELWSAKLGDILNNDWGDGPRGTPAVSGDLVYALSGKGVLTCLNTADGKQVWQKTMGELGGKVPGWGYTESVLVDGDKVLCTPGGSKGTVAAFDKKTGNLLWQSESFKDPAHYSSIVPADLNGTHQYVQLTEKNVAGISAADGKLLWSSSFPGRTAVIPTPIVHDGLVYVTAGYGAGCKLVKPEANGEPAVKYENKVMKNHHGGVILLDGHIYGHSDGYAWVCQNFMTGEEVWNHRAFGKGAIGYADGRFYCLEEGTGTVALVEASTKGWQEHGRLKLDPQSKIRSSRGRIWTHPVISNGKLYLRDQDLIYCYDVKAK